MCVCVCVCERERERDRETEREKGIALVVTRKTNLEIIGKRGRKIER